jgi:F0F1-type ATP synthase membrane subunit b/b'
MIKARTDAAAIIKDAEDRAKALREDAEQRYRLLISDYKMLKNNIMAARSDAMEKLRVAMKSLDDFERRFSCVDHDIANSVSHINEQ